MSEQGIYIATQFFVHHDINFNSLLLGPLNSPPPPNHHQKKNYVRQTSIYKPYYFSSLFIFELQFPNKQLA